MEMREIEEEEAGKKDECTRHTHYFSAICTGCRQRGDASMMLVHNVSCISRHTVGTTYSCS